MTPSWWNEAVHRGTTGLQPTLYIKQILPRFSQIVPRSTITTAWRITHRLLYIAQAPATLLPRTKVYQASSIWSSPSTSVLPSTGIGEPGKFTWCKPLQKISGREPPRPPDLQAVVPGETYKGNLCHTISTTSSINPRHVRSSAAPPFSHSDSSICLFNVLYQVFQASQVRVLVSQDC